MSRSTRRGQTLGLKSPCRSRTDPRVAPKGKNDGVVKRRSQKPFCGCSARHPATSGLLFYEEAHDCSRLMFGWEQRARKVKLHLLWEVSSQWGGGGMSDRGTFPKSCRDVPFALLLNLRSQYPRASLKRLSITMRERERGGGGQGQTVTVWQTSSVQPPLRNLREP